jgi:thymidylate kinase
MLITFSGIVGGGKSTNAKQACRFLQDAGYATVYFRFRFLTARRIFRSLFINKHATVAPSKEKPKKTKLEASPRRRKLGKLTLTRALGYLGRIVIFRIFAAVWLRRKIIIIDRFYYDNLAHYSLAGFRERFYLTLLKKALPVPDLAMMLLARPQTILRRRPNYDSEYIHQLYRRYQQVAHEFPQVVVLRTDRLQDLTAIILQHVRQAVTRERHSGPLPHQVLQ